MSSANDFTRHVPGFDFLQGLLKNAGASLPGVGQWIAPTLDPEELDKRIRDLKTVHFWLEQNAKLLATTIQALEVQRMTLSTLKSMNMPMADLAEALKARPAAPAPPPAPAPAPPPPPPPAAAAPAPEPQPAAAAAAAPLVDPMQWWGALTQQFTELAARAVKEGAEGPFTLPTGAPKAGRPAGQGRAVAHSEGKAGAKAAAKPAEKATRQSAPKSARSASGGARPSASPRPRRSGT
jgi:hypothetical protein